MLRLLIVDDEEIIRESIAKMTDWNSIGYELVAVAKNGIEAFDMICDEYPDVVITDLEMPILNGLDLIERSIALDKDIRFIILSGYGEFEYAKKAMQYGVRHYLLKPTEKQQLLQALMELKQEYKKNKQSKLEEEKLGLHNMLSTIQKCFLMEALNCQMDLKSVLIKYEKFIAFPAEPMQLCMCSYLEEKHLQHFIVDLNRICKNLNLSLLFPVIYVKNTAVIVLSTEDLSIYSSLCHKIENLYYENQSVSFEIQMKVFEDFQKLLEVLLCKIQRYSRILLYPFNEEAQEIQNSNIAFWKIDELSMSIKNSTSHEKAIQILKDAFQPIVHLDNAITLAISLSLRLKAITESSYLDDTPKFLEQLNLSQSVSDALEITKTHILNIVYGGCKDDSSIKASIESLKDYVTHHLDATHLSLKWLAENYLFISIGYLSKQFIKEEGERFSDYLNRQRMEKAKQLLIFYNNGNIKDVANEVGFGNNPRYFSQVFKRYTGLTPTEFVENINQHP